MSCSVHDLAAFEALGLPAVLVTTPVFEDALDAQARTVGIDPRHVFVAHPIQDRTDAELHELAEAATESVLKQLTAPRAAVNRL